MILTRGLNISIHLFDEVSGQFKHHLSLNRTEDLSNIPSATFMFAATLSNKLKQTHPRWCFPCSILWRSEKQVMKFNINGLKHRPTHTGAVRFVCFVRWIEPLCSLTAQKRKGSSDKVNKERKLCSLTLSRVGAAESSLRRRDNSLCSLLLTDNMLLKSNQMHSWMNLPPLSVQLFEKRLPSLFFSSPAGTPRLREQIILKAED